MPQTITSVAVLGARYPSGIQYRVFDAAGTFYPGPADNLASGTHLGNGVWRAVATLPDAGGEVRWYASAGAAVLAVDVIEPAPGAIAGEAVATAVWSYAVGDRSLSGPQAISLVTSDALIKALVLGGFEIDYDLSTATQRNPDGTVRQVFDLQDKDGNPATSAQTAVKRVPQ